MHSKRYLEVAKLEWTGGRILKFCALGSGSSGNSILVVGKAGSILIDCGLSARSLRQRVHSVGARMSDIAIILYSHTHSDHFKTAIKVAGELKVPVTQISNGRKLDIAGLAVSSFALPHDEDTVGYRIEGDGGVLGVALDAGCFTPLMIDALRGCDALILGCDYDEDMLAASDRAELLKKRIASNTGHISNGQLEEFLREHWDGRANTVVLAHLSQECNTPEFALLHAHQGIMARKQTTLMPEIIVSLPMQPTRLVEVKA